MKDSNIEPCSQYDLKRLLISRFIRTALFPVVVFFAIVVAVALFTIAWISSTSQDDLIAQAEQQLVSITSQKAENLAERLKGVRRQAELLQTEGARLVCSPESFPHANYSIETETSPKGIVYKSKNNGGASALNFSSRKKNIKDQMLFLRSENLDPLLSKIHDSDKNIALTYFMTDDSFLRMYPWQDNLHKNVSVNLDLSKVMVYYQADFAHNPLRQPKWTNVYLDHIGYGWMVSCTAPLYNSEKKMKGVVGIDLTVKHFEKYLSGVPKYINPLLLDRNKNIIYTTSRMEKNFGILSLKDRLEPGSITEEFIFPDEFNLLNTPKVALASQMKKALGSRDTVTTANINQHEYMICVADVKEAGWSLMMMADEDVLLSSQKNIKDKSLSVIVVASCVFICFLIGFIFYIRSQAKFLGNSIAKPINDLDVAVDAAAKQNDLPDMNLCHIAEIDHLAENFKFMNNELRQHRDNLETIISERTEQLKSANEELHIALKETKEAQHALIRAERLAAVGTLAGGVAHEFNNINTSVLGFTELALSELSEDIPVRKHLDRVRRSALRARSISTNLLTFSGSMDGKTVKSNLVDVLNDTLDLVKEKFIYDGILFELHIDDVPFTQMDQAQIGQVILNLLVNAQHALIDQRKRVIEITTGATEHEVWVSIEDSGCGIDEEQIPRIFSPFFSTKGEHSKGNTGHSKVRGTGLGLSVSQTIVQNHEGNLRATSVLGKGSCFTLILPIKKLEQGTSGAMTGMTSKAKYSDKKTVLVLDDDEDIRDLLNIKLEKDGFNVIDTHDGDEALALCRAGDIDLVLLDMQMPEISGRDFIEKVNAESLEIKCLIISGLQGDQIDDMLQRKNVCGFLSKPFTIGEVALKINQYLS